MFRGKFLFDEAFDVVFMGVGVGAALLLVVFLYALIVVNFAEAAFHCNIIAILVLKQ